MMACAQWASAGTDIYFNPLNQSATVAQHPNHITDNTPWQMPAGVHAVNLTQFIINVQHPDSTVDVTNGMGDATWLIDIKDVVAPPCLQTEDDSRHHNMACNNAKDVQFIEKLMRAAKK